MIFNDNILTSKYERNRYHSDNKIDLKIVIT